MAATLRVQELEAELDAAKAEVNRLELQELPQAFTEDGISELRLPDRGIGAKRDIAVRGSLPVEEPRHGLGLARLDEYGHGDNIRSIVTANFGRMHREAARDYYEAIRTDNRAAASLTETIHHSTLRAIGLERAKAGMDTDWDNLGLIVQRRVTLLRPPTHRTTRETGQ